MSERRLSRHLPCVKCTMGRLAVDPIDHDLYCINCGYRQTREPNERERAGRDLRAGPLLAENWSR